MIQYFTDLPIEKQTRIVLVIGWVLLVVSAAIREKIVASECRNWARLMGFAGAGLLSLQTIHATMLAEELNRELMVRRGTHDVQQTEAVATQIANPVRVVAVASEYSTAVQGRTISITKYSDGRIGPVSVTAGRINSSGDRTGSSIDQFAAEGGTGHGAFSGSYDVPHEQHAVKF